MKSTAFDCCINSGELDSIYPTALFSRPHIFVERTIPDLPLLTSTIRASYKDMVPALRLEPRGERIGFFVQAEYFVKSVAVTIAALSVTGIYFGVRAIQSRRM